MNLIQQEKGEKITFFFAVFFLVLIRYLYFGFKYYPQLDDYIQHHNYAQLVDQMFGGDIIAFSKWLGLFSARPLAGILDITLWSWFWPCAIIGVILISAIYAFAAVEFYKLFSKLFDTSCFFVVVFALFPLGFEGTYWMSASTRIVPGLLLTALSAKTFVSFLERGMWYSLLLSAFLQLLTFGFYEQTAVLSCALNVVIGLLYINKNVKLRWLFAPMGIVSAAIYFCITKLAGPSQLYDGRSNVIASFNAEYFNTYFPDLLSQLKSAFLGGGFYTFIKGFARGVAQIISDAAIIYVLFVITACILLWYLASRKKRGADKENSTSALSYILIALVGCGLIVAPLAPFFILQGTPWFSLRGTVTSFVGIALVADVFVRIVTQNRRRIIAYICAAFAFVFCICSVSELADYKANYENDQCVVSAVATVSKDYPNGGKVAILNVDPTYLEDMNCYFHEHVTGVTESSWALTGAVRCYNNYQLDHMEYVPISLRNNPTYKAWEYSTKSIGSMNGVYLYHPENNSIEKMYVEIEDEHTFNIYYKNGDIYARVVETPAQNTPWAYEGRIFEE